LREGDLVGIAEHGREIVAAVVSPAFYAVSDAERYRRHLGVGEVDPGREDGLLGQVLGDGNAPSDAR